MKKLEAMRLEVDSRRRTVVELDKQLVVQKMKTMRRAEVGGCFGVHIEVPEQERVHYTRHPKLHVSVYALVLQSMREANGGTYVEDIKMADMIKNTDRKKAHKEDKMQGEKPHTLSHTLSQN